MANKNQKVAMYIAIGIALALILLSSTSILDNLKLGGLSVVSIPDTGGMKVQVSVTQGELGEILKLLVITPQGVILEPGETRRFTESSEIWEESCNTMEGLWSVKKGTNVLKSGVINKGSVYGGASMTFNFDVTAGSSMGDYSIETNWRCNGQVLGQDGRFGGTDAPFTTTFSVSDDGGVIPPPPEKKYCWLYNGLSRTCESILIDSSSQCLGSWKDTEQQCLAEVCKQDGGTKVCDDPDDPPGFKFDYNIIVILGIIAVIIAIIMRRNK